MPVQLIFPLQMTLGYVAWLLCFGAYILPWLRSMPHARAQRVIATLHSFRFFGLVFIMPGVVGAGVPHGFSDFSAYADLATSVLALLALAAYRIRPLFWMFALAFNVVGLVDMLVDYDHAVQSGLAANAGQLGAAYAIPVLYVPLLAITHVAALIWMARAAMGGTRARESRAIEVSG